MVNFRSYRNKDKFPVIFSFFIPVWGRGGALVRKVWGVIRVGVANRENMIF